MTEGNTKTNKKFGPQKESLLTYPPPPLDAYVPICWYTAVGVCAVRKFDFFTVTEKVPHKFTDSTKSVNTFLIWCPLHTQAYLKVSEEFLRSHEKKDIKVWEQFIIKSQATPNTLNLSKSITTASRYHLPQSYSQSPDTSDMKCFVSTSINTQYSLKLIGIFNSSDI